MRFLFGHFFLGCGLLFVCFAKWIFVCFLVCLCFFFSLRLFFFLLLAFLLFGILFRDSLLFLLRSICVVFLVRVLSLVVSVFV